MATIDDKNMFYLGNQKLKKTNVPVNFTKKQIMEFGKCASDPVYFIKKYVKIINPNKGLTNFDLWEFQEEMVSTFVDSRFSICKIPRQSGKTQTVVAVLLWYTLFHENYSIAVLAHKLSQAREIISRYRFSYEHLPKWLQQGIVEWSKTNIILENGSKIEASATSGNSVRGKTYNCVYLDEFAFVPNNLQSEFFATVLPTISAGDETKMIITSTPNGVNNIFHKLWVDSEQEKNSFVSIAVHWSDIPGRDDEWRRKTIENSSLMQFNQEYGCEFLGSQHTLISGEILSKMPTMKPIKENEDMAVYIDTATKRVRNRLYIIVVDTSRGVGGDYNAFVIFDVTEIPYQVVARYRNNTISPLLFPDIIYQFAKTFNDAYICVEVNDNGQQVADIIYREMEYENMIFSQHKGRTGQSMSTGFGHKPSLGVRTTKLVKRVGCTNLKTLVENNKLFINDLILKEEFYTFIEMGDTYSASDGNHDDMVMCCVIFSWLVQQPYFKDWTDTNVRERMVSDNLKLIDDDLLPVMSDEEYPLYDTGEIKEVSYREFERFLLRD